MMTGFGIVGRTDGRTDRDKTFTAGMHERRGADTEEWEALTLGPL